MKKNMFIGCIILFVILMSYNCPNPPDPTEPTTDYSVIINGQIVSETGFGMGVDDSQHNRSWVSFTSECLRMQYPGGLSWGAVFITVGGDPVNPPRPSKDFSGYSKLAIEMKGAVGGECVQVGMKDTDDPDDGSEMKHSVQVTPNWEIYEFNLSDFSSCQLSRVYVVTEFVFPCPGQNQAQTIDVKTIRFLR